MANTSNGIKIIYGAGALSSGALADSPEKLEKFHVYSGQVLELLKAEQISTLDTAEIYAGSEQEIAYHGGASKFVIDTKIAGGFGKPRHKDEIVAAGQANLERLKTKQVDVLYLHAPETTVPFEEQLSALQELYEAGVYKRLGVSNFSAAQVDELCAIADKHGWIRPTVYQGNYSAVARLSETQILPTLRKHGISYNVYSPIAGGFLAKTRQQIEEGAGRFNNNSPVGQMYTSMYNKPSYLDALDKWVDIAADAGISKAELAYRWVTYHSALDGNKGDGIIFGARSVEQVKETIGYIRAGPLKDEHVKRVDDIWTDIKDDAPLDNFHR